jgi:multidrug efflux system membrane fusion protein
VKLSPKVLVPAAILGITLAATASMILARPSAESTRPPTVVPLVEVMRVQPQEVALRVEAQGSVEPRTESELVAEVAGRIVSVSPQLASGGSFEDREILVRIDPRDYDVALEGARAARARANSSLVHAKATAHRQRSMHEKGIASQARLDEAIHAEANAEASVREANVAIRRAELDLDRTRIRAPFTGRVREKHVDVGQFVSRGAPIARVYSVDYAEVRLPVRDVDLAHLELPGSFGSSEAGADDAGPAVELSARVAGRVHVWQAHVVRAEAARDPRTRMLNVVARVIDPYTPTADRPALPIGIFVDASIEGRRVDGVYALPRTALRRGDEVLVVDENDQLRTRKVHLLRSDRDRVWIDGGLVTDDRVVTSTVGIATDGMNVRTLETSPEAPRSAADQSEATGAPTS